MIFVNQRIAFWIKNSFIVALLVILPNSFVSAKVDISSDFANWTGLFFQADFDKPIGYYLEVQDRINQNLSVGNRFIVRPAVRFNILPGLSLWAGYGWLPAFSPFLNESRLWQQAFYQFDTRLWQFIGRLRVDERWLGNTDALAYRGRIMVRVLKFIGQRDSLALCGWSEYFQNLNTVIGGPQAGFDQSRSFLGINFPIAKGILIEPGYSNVLVNQPQSSAKTMNHVFLLYGIFNI